MGLGKVLSLFLEMGCLVRLTSAKDHKNLCTGDRRGCLKWLRKLSQDGGEVGVQRVEDGAGGGDMPLPFPGS